MKNDVFEYLKLLTADTFISPTHGIGMRAIRDIKKGERIFPLFGGKTNIYVLPKKDFLTLDEEIQKMVLKSFVNYVEKDIVWFRLTKDCYFNLATPFRYVNTGLHDGKENVCSWKKVALKNISKGEEILSNYDLNLINSWFEK